MRGKFLIIAGVGLLIFGALALYRGYENSDPSTSAIAWAALIGGVIALLAGISRQVSAFMSHDPSDESQYGQAEVRALIQSMGEMAAADGKIEPREVATIASIHEKMLGTSISFEEVNSILMEFHENDNIRDKLRTDRKKVNPAMKRMIIQSCYLVMIADEEKAESELVRLLEIGDALNLPKSEVQHLISMASKI